MTWRDLYKEFCEWWPLWVTIALLVVLISALTFGGVYCSFHPHADFCTSGPDDYIFIPVIT